MPEVVTAVSVSFTATVAELTVAASLVPFTVTVTWWVVPSAEVTVKVSVAVAPLLSA
ncbi:hypothetical protein JCM19232_1559 [Vibrio ishigakensis]|uniref:Uncharacterized protein n=1 Tax=Vibrio ishigakensis TaxID=1481914 RepID=A0A0B8PFP8_9VIBR|nr:hypothetical protein JCM19232_1559 [Vibrio ishigakensis]